MNGKNKKYPGKRKYKFTPDSRNPDKKPKMMRDAKDPSEVLPIKNGIYKKQPPIPPTPTEKKPKKKKKSLFGNRKYKVQHSSHKQAKKAMRKNVRKRQRNKPITSLFDL